MGMSSILNIESVSKAFASKAALQDVSLEIEKGTVFGLLGPNGAGKTTLIRIINRITAPDSGSVFFDGRPLSGDDIRKIGYLPEERGLYRKMKVGEQAVYLAMLKGMPRKDARRALAEWFERFEIISWWDKKIEELSKGMAQKIQFVTTVVHKPQLLILDEPFSGFDPINTQLIKNEILNLNKEGITIVFSTHNMSSVEEICQDIALINNSKLVLTGEVNEVMKKYKENIFELEYTGDAEAMDTLKNGNLSIVERNVMSDGSQKIRIKAKEETSLNQLLSAAIPKVEVHAAREILPSMNEVFINVVSEHNNPSNNSNDE
jgi:ABC-2 type transport system ATP-binding protein